MRMTLLAVWWPLCLQASTVFVLFDAFSFSFGFSLCFGYALCVCNRPCSMRKMFAPRFCFVVTFGFFGIGFHFRFLVDDDGFIWLFRLFITEFWLLLYIYSIHVTIRFSDEMNPLLWRDILFWFFTLWILYYFFFFALLDLNFVVWVPLNCYERCRARKKKMRHKRVSE